jgi:histidyl-tRNA synthetase
VPGVGWACGLDRIVLALQAAGRLPAAGEGLDVQVLPLAARAAGTAIELVRDLRRAGIAADRPYTERTLKGHMKAATRAGVRAVVLLGDEELAAGAATVRDMAAHVQEAVPLDQVVAHLAALLSKGPGA